MPITPERRLKAKTKLERAPPANPKKLDLDRISDLKIDRAKTMKKINDKNKDTAAMVKDRRVLSMKKSSIGIPKKRTGINKVATITL
jgi:hypothetical protein